MGVFDCVTSGAKISATESREVFTVTMASNSSLNLPNMPFKVVQTREDGQIFITFCPELWENGGKLWWPQSLLQGEKLKKQEYLKPGKDWSVLDCEVKRWNLTLEQAKAEVDNMSDVSETEEDEESKSKAKKRKVCEGTKNKKTICLNNLAEQCIEDQINKSSTGNGKTIPVLQDTPTTSFILAEHLVGKNNSSTTPSNKSLETEEVREFEEQQTSGFIISALDENVTYQLCDSDVPVINQSRDIISSYPSHAVLVEENNPIEDTSEEQNNVVILNHDSSTKHNLDEKVNILLSALVVVQEGQKRVENALERVTKMVINIDTKFDEYFKKAQDIQRSEHIGMKPIANKKSLIDFEEKLKHPTVASDLKRKFLTVCGVGKGNGMSNCYFLVDIMFARQFLTECSWSGGSRKENQTKVCFKAYELTVNFFFSIIQESDPSFTIKECESFFKNVLRNSNRRNSAKGLRASSSRVRPKKVKSKNSSTAKASSSGPNTTINNVLPTDDLTKTSSCSTDQITERKDNDCDDQ